VPGEQQVMLKVRVAELSREARLKINHCNLDTESCNGSAVFNSVLSADDLKLALQAVGTTCYAKILAEPNLVTLNGKPANFFAGGEFPVGGPVGCGGANAQFRAFGTQLTFTPTIIDKDRIRLTVSPSFSSLNPSLSVQGVPGVSNRSVSTTVDLRAGQWLAIAGLLQDQQCGMKKPMPVMGHLPVVGSLFCRADAERHETELIVLVSPTLVHPLDALEAPMVLPGMEFGGKAACGSGCGKQGQCVHGNQGCSAPRGAPAAGSAQANRRAAPAAGTRPDYQRSEKYYVYGPHGTSQ
jgi:pilus assembly protein CpaC